MLAAPLLAFAPLASAQAADSLLVAPGDTLLTITAEGKSTRTPDLATFSTGVQTTGKTASEAMKANAAAMSKVVAALTGAGVANRDIQTSNLSLNPVYEDRSNQPQSRQDLPPRIVGYQAANTVNVRARDLARMGQVIDALVAAGANQVNGPDFALDKPEAALDEARADAIRSARARADLYARATGLKVLRVVSIAESGGYSPQPRVYRAKAMAMDAATPVAAGEVGMNVSVTVQYELAP
jgi:uncharacterized protein YggE